MKYFAIFNFVIQMDETVLNNINKDWTILNNINKDWTILNNINNSYSTIITGFRMNY